MPKRFFTYLIFFFAERGNNFFLSLAKKVIYRLISFVVNYCVSVEAACDLKRENFPPLSRSLDDLLHHPRHYFMYFCAGCRFTSNKKQVFAIIINT
jgi:hypothetical protein